MGRLRNILKGKDAETPAEALAAPALEKPSAASAASKSGFPNGIKQLHPPGDAAIDAEVDICFVHGLTGDWERTWTAEGESAPWPQTLLPSYFPKARILTFGYDAYVVQLGVASINGLDNHADRLLSGLANNRHEHKAESRPLIFVCHSLGGIVCKQAVSFSKRSTSKDLHDIYDSVIGIAFMGTPHHGTSLARWASIPISTLGVVKSVNKKLTDVLRVDDPLLQRTHREFLEVLRERQDHGRSIHLICYYEELPIFKRLVVVTQHSATIDGSIALSIHANHTDMVRFASKDNNDFVLLRQELAKWVEKSRENKAFDADPENRRCLQDLYVTDPDDDRTRLEKKNGTYFENIHDWVFSNDTYKQWRAGDPQHRLLWIRGDPGKGKTMIMCSIIRNLKASGTTLSYFFCQATNERLNHATAVLRGLLYMFIRKHPTLVAHVRKHYDIKGKQFLEGENAWEALSKIFTDMIKDRPLAKVVVLVDGLDECTAGRSHLLELIMQPSHVRWLVSSRNWNDIQESFHGAKQKIELRLELNPDAISEAVNAYIKLKVGQLALKNLKDETLDSVEKYLLANADGTFLWVALVCHVLERVQPWDVLKKVTSFPRGLSALYDRMIQTIQDVDSSDDADDADDVDNAKLCFDILAVASTVYRPITLDNLRTLCHLPEGLNDEHLETVVQLCGSFLTLRDKTLYFVHQSAKDYLVRKAKDKIFPHGCAGCQHHVIASCSLQALTTVLKRDIYGLKHANYPILSVKAPADDPLAPVDYSCRFWVDHLAESEPSQRSVSLQDGNEVHVFLLNKFLYWLEAQGLLRDVWTGVVAMRKLHTMMDGRNHDLAQLVYDAYRFISSWAQLISKTPLQTYASALLFSPTNSLVRRQFAKEKPDWVTVTTPGPASWDACIPTPEDDYDTATSVAFSPDGLTLASASSNTVKIRDVFSGQYLHTLECQSEVLAVTFSPDGKRLVSSAGKTITIWDSITVQPVHNFISDTPAVLVVVSQDSLRVATVSRKWRSGAGKDVIKVWDMLSGRCTDMFGSHDMATTSVVFLPDGKNLASGSTNGNIFIWDPAGRLLQTLKGHRRSILTVGIFLTPDSWQLVSCDEVTTVKLWNVSSGQCTQSVKLQSYVWGRDVALFSPKGRKLALAENDKIELWEFPEQGLRTTSAFKSTDYYQIEVCSGAFSSDGQKLATGIKREAAKIWDLTATSRQAPDYNLGHIYFIDGIGFMQDENLMGWQMDSGGCKKSHQITLGVSA